MMISNEKLFASVPAFQVITDLKLPVRTAFLLSRVATKVNSVLTDVDAVKKTLIDQGKDPDQTDVKEGRIKLLNPDEFMEKLTELMAVETDLDIEPIPLAALGDVSIEPRHLMALDWLITAE